MSASIVVLLLLTQLPPISQASMNAPSFTLLEVFRWPGVEDELKLTDDQRKSLRKIQVEAKNLSGNRFAELELSFLNEEVRKLLNDTQQLRADQLRFQINVAMKREWAALRTSGIPWNRESSRAFAMELAHLPNETAKIHHRAAWTLMRRLLVKHTSEEEAKRLMGKPFVVGLLQQR